MTERPAEPVLPDMLADELDVVFVGAAPSLYAAERGHYYAGPRNRFWLVLYQAGFTPRQLREEEDSEVLRYGIGLTAILPSIASSDNSKLPIPSDSERLALRERLMRYAPRVVCYNGKDVYRMCSRRETARWGLLKERLGESLQFVVPSTSGRADGWGAERLWFFRELRRLVDSLRHDGDS